MFSSISLAGLSKSRMFGYAAKSPFFQGRKRVDFKPGLNILFGPNGSGKSTLLHILARTMCAEQGGVSTVTQDVLYKNIDFGNMLSTTRKLSSNIGLKVAHDGQPVLFCDPRDRKGISAGGRIDYDFPAHIAFETSSRGSHGEKSWDRSALAIGPLTGHQSFPTKIDRKIVSSNVNDAFRSAIALMDDLMAPTIEKGQGSILLDEPESNFSLLWQEAFWAILASESAAKFQVIVASHSPFALGISNANYIDLVPGYREDVENLLKNRFSSPT